ncbi:hypothetical protein BC937DRAFT_93288, partial [Endogone sp. FLAS-F59071]
AALVVYCKNYLRRHRQTALGTQPNTLGYSYTTAPRHGQMATTTTPTPPAGNGITPNPVVHIDRFREIFPHLSPEIIESVVRQNQCLYEPSLNALLMLSDPNFSPESVQNNPQQSPNPLQQQQQPVGEEVAEYTSTPLNQLQLDEAYARSLVERDRGNSHGNHQFPFFPISSQSRPLAPLIFTLFSATSAPQNHLVSPSVHGPSGQYFQGQPLPGQPFLGQPFPGQPLLGQPFAPQPQSFNGVMWVPVQAAPGYAPIVYMYPGQSPYLANGTYLPQPTYPGAPIYPNSYIPGTGATMPMGQQATPTPTATPTSTTSSPPQNSRNKTSFGGLFKNLRRGNTTATQRNAALDVTLNQQSRGHSPSITSSDDIPDARPVISLARTLSNDSTEDLIHHRRARGEVVANPFGDENEAKTESDGEQQINTGRQSMPSQPGRNRAYLFHDNLDRIARVTPTHPDSTQPVSPDNSTSGIQSQNLRRVQVPEVTLPAVAPQRVQSPREKSPEPEPQLPEAQSTKSRASVPSPWG